MQEGYGACLLKKPELLKDMVEAVRSRTAHLSNEFTVSIKIRIHENIKYVFQFMLYLFHFFMLFSFELVYFNYDACYWSIEA